MLLPINSSLFHHRCFLLVFLRALHSTRYAAAATVCRDIVLTTGLVFVELVEKVLWHSTVNIECSMRQATTVLPCRRQHVSWLKVAFNIFVESQSSRMQHVAYVASVESRLYIPGQAAKRRHCDCTYESFSK